MPENTEDSTGEALELCKDTEMLKRLFFALCITYTSGEGSEIVKSKDNGGFLKQHVGKSVLSCK